jgi:uncharacterized membrane protein AbrB (regulator of aidB expression)
MKDDPVSYVTALLEEGLFQTVNDVPCGTWRGPSGVIVLFAVTCHAVRWNYVCSYSDILAVHLCICGCKYGSRQGEVPIGTLYSYIIIIILAIIVVIIFSSSGYLLSFGMINSVDW